MKCNYKSVSRIDALLIGIWKKVFSGENFERFLNPENFAYIEKSLPFILVQNISRNARALRPRAAHAPACADNSEIKLR